MVKKKKSTITDSSELLENEEPASLSLEEEPTDEHLVVAAEHAETAVIATNLHAQDPMLDSTQMYLKEIGYSPLLTAEEEVQYGRLALKGDEAARKK